MGRKKKKGLSKSIFLMQRVCVASILKEEKKKDGKIERKYFIKCRSDEQMEGKFAEDL